MKLMLRQGLLIASLASTLACSLSEAAVVSVSAIANTAIQEFINAEPASFTADNAQSGAGVQLPITAASQIDSTDLAGVLLGRSKCFSQVSDPTRLDEPNPQEFALEAACYSDDPSVTYEIGSTAEESRTLVFVSSPQGELLPEIAFDANRLATVRSRAFVSGAILVWSADPATSLDEVECDLEFNITASSNSTVEQTVFQTSVSVAGADIDVSGPISVAPVSAAELGDLGLDDASVDVLSDLETAGNLRIWIIEEQSHAYTYGVVADQELVLAARLDIALRNALGGTGVAAVLGRPFENLADFVESALPGIDGQALEKSLNASISATASIDPILPPHCGAMGLELAALVIPFIALLRLGTCRRP